MRHDPSTVALFFLLTGCWSPSGTSDPGPQVQRILADSRYEWVTIETENTRIHFPAEGYAEKMRSSLPERAEGARREVLARLSVSDYPDLLHLFYVDDREDMANLTGNPVTGYSYFNDHAAVVVFNESWRAFERHELTHTVTLGTWAEPAGPAVVEGLATYVDGACGGYDNGRIARTFLDQGVLIPLETLSGDFRTQNDLIAYLQAGAVIEFVVDSVGPGTVDLLWDQGLLASPDLLGISPEVFQREFEEWLASRYAPIPDVALEAIRGGGCGVVATSDG